MGRAQIKKKDCFIDMTPMSDVMVLLLTFFMLTSTFTKREPVKVMTPSSVSEIKIPTKGVLQILVDKTGKVFMSLDNENDLDAVLGSMSDLYNYTYNSEQKTRFIKDPVFGVPMNKLNAYLNESDGQVREKLLKSGGIPCDSVNGQHSEFENWVLFAKQNNPDLKIAIKADAGTPYSVVKKVMSSLQDIRENRYYLITSLKKLQEED
jgi:biopolymer transport protein ExbD